MRPYRACRILIILKFMKPKLLFLCFLVFSAATFSARAQLSSRQIDSLSEKVLKTFDVPGIAVAVIKDGKLIHSKGYGLRSLKTKEPVNEHTLFGIASNSKAFTAAALGMMVDEGKLSWDDKVVDLIPDFKLYNPYVTQEFTVRDLLTHRSGLGLGAGDLMIWPDSGSVTKTELIHNLHYLKPVSAFRTKYDYDNLLYVVAGEVLAKVSGMSWEDFIEKRIMQPLGMSESAAAYLRLKSDKNTIDAHAPVNGKVEVIGKNFTQIANAAGGIWSNLEDMSKWAIMQMNNGKYGSQQEKSLFSEKAHREMWSPQTIIRGSSPYNTHFSSYGLGWFLSDVKGYFQATHTGGLGGIVTQVTLIPELKLGIIVLTNQQSGAAFNAVTNSIKDSYFGIKGKDRIGQYRENELKNQREADQITNKVWADIAAAQKKTKDKPDLNNYTGTFADPWFGKVTITDKNGVLWFQSVKSPKLCGTLSFYKGNTFIAKWKDRSMDADAYLLFSLDKDGKAWGLKMEAISPLTDFSYDFQDLDFTRSEKE